MKKFSLFCLSALLLIAPLGAAPTSNEALLKQISRGFAQVAKNASGAVVYIESQASSKEAPLAPRKKKNSPSNENPFDYFNEEFFNRFFGFPQREDKPKPTETVRGSGFLVSADGYIMTNYHVVENTSKVNVTLHSGKKYVATIVGVDPKTDLAVIKISDKNLPFLKFGDSDALEVGDWAIAIGNPFGLQTSVTVGVVSAKGRNQLHINDFEDFIQTDAAINPGNSGGPLLDIQGEVIGINTAIVSGSGGYMGIGFAIPSNMAKGIMEQLIASGSVTRGFLGVTLQPIDEDLATFYKLDKTQGALIADVAKGSPADLAGLKQEDIILSYNQIPVENLSAFRNAIALTPPGTALTLKVHRDGKLLDIKVTITASPSSEGEATLSMQKLGFSVQTLTPELAEHYSLSDDKGVLITQVKAGSLAAEAGLRAGMVIVAVNRKKIFTTEEFQLALQEAVKEQRLLLMLRQGEAYRFVAIPLN